jgi:hypothetical protein
LSLIKLLVAFDFDFDLVPLLSLRSCTLPDALLPTKLASATSILTFATHISRFYHYESAAAVANLAHALIGLRYGGSLCEVGGATGKVGPPLGGPTRLASTISIPTVAPHIAPFSLYESAAAVAILAQALIGLRYGGSLCEVGGATGKVDPLLSLRSCALPGALLPTRPASATSIPTFATHISPFSLYESAAAVANLAHALIGLRYGGSHLWFKSKRVTVLTRAARQWASTYLAGCSML